ncbi:hypothetical protein PO864_19710 (plasmid) [Providencia alcalifaciens]|uniref:hypothetical protein n=1 Tax=Providencia alcalifaciens TaxID=126385 RepID=UPI0027A26EE7|nr:hypothetical protein PO864_19710 [Providencia alcalifaciens]
MNPAGLSRAVSLGNLAPDMSNINNIQTPLGGSVRGVEGSRIQRSHSCPDLSGGKLELFAAFQRKANLESLIGTVKSESAQQKLRDILTQSPNASAKHEVERFASVFRQLKQNPALTQTQQGLLLELAEQYAEKIIADGLGSKSAFGPWNGSNQKNFKKRQELEHKLANLVCECTQGDGLALGNNFAQKEVLPFILSCLQDQFGCGLSDESAQQIVQLVDKAAMQALEAIRQRYLDLIEEQGQGVGKQARDLETIGMMPLLLRNILANIPKELLPDEIDSTIPRQPRDEDPAGPADPNAPTGPTEPLDRGITINVGGINIDNRSYNYDSHDITTTNNTNGNDSQVTKGSEDASTSTDDIASTTENVGDDVTSTSEGRGNSISSGSQTSGDDLSATLGQEGTGGGHGGDITSSGEGREAISSGSQTSGDNPFATLGQEDSGGGHGGGITSIGEDREAISSGSQTSGDDLSVTLGQEGSGGGHGGGITSRGEGREAISSGSQTSGDNPFATLGQEDSGGGHGGGITSIGEGREAISSGSQTSGDDLSVTLGQEGSGGGHGGGITSRGEGREAISSGSQTSGDNSSATLGQEDSGSGHGGGITSSGEGRDTISFGSEIPGDSVVLDGHGQGGVTGNPGAVANAGINPVSPSDNGAYAGVLLKDNLRASELPSETVARGVLFDPADALLSATRRALEPKDNQRSDEAKGFEQLRNALLPSSPTARHTALQRTADAPEYDEQLNTLTNILQNHPGLVRNRPVLQGFAMMLSRVSGLSTQTPSSPLLGAIMAGLNVPTAGGHGGEVANASTVTEANGHSGAQGHPASTGLSDTQRGASGAEGVNRGTEPGTSSDGNGHVTPNGRDGASGGNASAGADQSSQGGASGEQGGNGVSGGNGQGGAAGNPGAVANTGINPVSPSDNGAYAGVLLKDNLRASELPSETVARGVLFDPADALLSATRRALEPKDNQRSDEAKGFEQLRNALLPSSPTARHTALQRTADAPEYDEQLNTLTNILQNHPGLVRNRPVLQGFAMMLSRVSGLSTQTPSSPLLGAIMAGLNVPTAGGHGGEVANASTVTEANGHSGAQGHPASTGLSDTQRGASGAEGVNRGTEPGTSSDGNGHVTPNGRDGASGGNGQGGAAGNPGAVANAGINPVSPSDNGAYAGVLLKDNLRASELPSETVARGVLFDPADALLSATRRALEPKDNQRSDEAKGFEQLRNALLPSSPTARHTALQRTADAPEYDEQLNTLTNILQNHPGLVRNRPVLQGFAMMLSRVSGLSTQTPSSPLLGAIMAGLNVPTAGGHGGEVANASTVTEANGHSGAQGHPASTGLSDTQRGASGAEGVNRGTEPGTSSDGNGHVTPNGRDGASGGNASAGADQSSQGGASGEQGGNGVSGGNGQGGAAGNPGAVANTGINPVSPSDNGAYAGVLLKDNLRASELPSETVARGVLFDPADALLSATRRALEPKDNQRSDEAKGFEQLRNALLPSSPTARHTALQRTADAPEYDEQLNTLTNILQNHPGLVRNRPVLQGFAMMLSRVSGLSTQTPSSPLLGAIMAGLNVPTAGGHGGEVANASTVTEANGHSGAQGHPASTGLSDTQRGASGAEGVNRGTEPGTSSDGNGHVTPNGRDGASGGNGQGGAAGNPGAVANAGINPVSPSDNGAYAGVLLKDNLRASELPSETVARGVLFDPADALLSATRRALEPKDNQRSDEAKGFEQLRNALLPSSPTARHTALQRTADAPEYDEQLNTLTNILQNHPGLVRNRPVLQGFAMMLSRVSGLSTQTPSSPLLGAIMAGLNVPTAGGHGGEVANASTVTEANGHSGAQGHPASTGLSDTQRGASGAEGVNRGTEPGTSSDGNGHVTPNGRDGASGGNASAGADQSSQGGASGEQGGNGVSGGNGQGGAAGNPGAVANTGINPVSPSDNGAYAGVLLKDNLRASELPSETVARGVLFDPADALLSATRRALEPKDNQRSDEAKGFEQLRNALLPSSPTARHTALQRTADAPEYDEQLNTLTNILQNHPGLVRNRPVLQGFAMMLNRVSGLSTQTPSSPLLGAIMVGLNVPTAGGHGGEVANASTVTEAFEFSIKCSSIKIGDSIGCQYKSKQ